VSSAGFSLRFLSRERVNGSRLRVSAGGQGSNAPNDLKAPFWDSVDRKAIQGVGFAKGDGWLREVVAPRPPDRWR